MTSVLCLIAVLPFLGLVTGFISPPPPLASSPTQSALCWRSSATFNSVVSSLSSSSRMDELDADAVDMTKEEVEMGDHTEPIHVPKDGENDYGGGSKFKRLMEQAQQRSRSSTSSTTSPAATTTTTATGGGVPPSTAASSQDAPLPSGWESTLDPSSGQTYYYNSSTQATSWTRPASTSPQEQQKEEKVAETATSATTVPSSSEDNTTTENNNDAMGLRMALRSSQLQVQELTTDLADAQSRILTMQELVTRLEDDTKVFKTEIMKLRERDDTTIDDENENEDTNTEDKVAGRGSNGTGTPTPNEETQDGSAPDEETTVAATTLSLATKTKVPKLDMTQQETETLHAAVLAMDVRAVTAMVDTQGMALDVNTTEAAFWAVVNAIDTAEHNDQALTGDISTMIHHIFDADFQHLLEREQIRTNITCTFSWPLLLLVLLMLLLLLLGLVFVR